MSDLTTREARKLVFALKNDARRQCRKADPDYRTHKAIRVAHSGYPGAEDGPSQAPTGGAFGVLDDKVWNLLVRGTRGAERGVDVVDWY